MLEERKGFKTVPWCIQVASICRQEGRKRKKREGRKEINGATKLLIFNQIISNNLGIIDSTKLFLTNSALLSFRSGLTYTIEELLSTPGKNWNASVGVCKVTF